MSNPPKDDPRFDAFFESFKKGMYAESKNDYGVINDSIKDKSRQALGKYQFVPKYHWGKIKSLASKRGYDTPKDYQDFLNNPTLQEEYFEEYTKKEVWPFVQKNVNNNKGLAMDEVGYLYHFDPNSADTYIKTGKTRPATSVNPSNDVALKRYKSARDEQGGKANYGFTVGHVQKKYSEYNKELDAVNSNPNKLSEDLLNQKRIDLQLKYQKQGLLPYFNKVIQDENVAQYKKGENELKDVQKTIDFINKDDYSLHDGPKGEGFRIRLGQDGPTAKHNEKMLQQQFKEAPLLKKYAKKEDGLWFVDIPRKNDGKNLFNEIQQKVEKTTGQKNFIYGEKGMVTTDVSKTKSFLSNLTPATMFSGFSLDDYDNDSGVFKDNAIGSELQIGNATALKPKYSIKPTLKEIAIPDEPTAEGVVDNTQPTPPKIESPNQNQPTQNDVDKLIAYDKEKTAKAKEEADFNVAEDYFGTEMKEPEVYNANQKFKDNFPWQDVLGAAGTAIIGLGMANTPIPLRDEQVNDDFRNYTAELSKLSQIGLRPEEEAYAKRMLTEAYQGSIDQITQASGGNRNLVLGNLGRVDAQKNKGLMEIALADASAKNEALHKYGEATKYINEFDARRDIANNERKYANVLQTKEAGANLAGASFAAMTDSVKNYQDNKPGSWNHMYKSHMSRRLFGIDTTLKDDGSGTQPYTASWKEAQDKKLLGKSQEYNAYRNVFQSLDPKKKEAVNNFMLNNKNNPNAVYKFIDYAKTNDVSTDINPDAIAEANRTGDYGMLFKGMNTPDESTTEQQNTVTSANGVVSDKQVSPIAQAYQSAVKSSDSSTNKPVYNAKTDWENQTIPEGERKFFENDGDWKVGEMDAFNKVQVDEPVSTYSEVVTKKITPASDKPAVPETQNITGNAALLNQAMGNQSSQNLSQVKERFQKSNAALEDYLNKNKSKDSNDEDFIKKQEMINMDYSNILKGMR